MTGRVTYLAILLAGILLPGVAARAAAPASPPVWNSQVLNLFATLPIQDEGRIKPMDTFASFKLLKFHGRRGCPDLEGKSLTPTAWLINSLFFPETAKQYKTFRVDNAEVIVAIGLQPGKKRDYYSYADLAPAREKLMDLGQRSMHVEDSQRSVMESELVALAMNLREFESILGYAEFARKQFSVAGSSTLTGLFPGQSACRLSEILQKVPQLLAAFGQMRKNDPEKDPELKAFSAFFQDIDTTVSQSDALALFPPPAGSRGEAWQTPADLTNNALSADAPAANQLALLADFEKLADATGDGAAFQQQLNRFHTAVTAEAQSRGEYEKISLEVLFYRLKLMYYALVLYFFGFLLVALTWMRPQSRLLAGGAFITVALSTVLLLAGIVLRCIIRERPPVTTLYETILFVTVVAVSMALFMEWVNRQGVALSLAAVLGVAGMFLANKYEASDGADTMVSMIAVLDTNFWLATHVTTITIGYAAGLLAGGMAHIFVVGKLIGLRRTDAAFYSGLSRLVYGGLCFSLLFSVVGTVLGGIWANESWGRFWGWDPKENGALMIVLWQLTILHAKSDGIIRDYGVNIAAIVGGVVVAFSWFGVNMLGVGLHSYGFANGAYTALMGFYAVEFLVVLLGCLAWFRDRHKAIA